MKEKYIKRFWSKVDIKSEDECWNWLAGKLRGGYGCFKVNSIKTLTHRFSYELKNGHIPEGMCICHKCDNPSCVNPSHLWLGTHQDNMKDRNMKDHNIKGSAHSVSKLTEQQILEIRNIININQTEIAKLYGVSKALISLIKNNKIWRHI